MVPSVRPLYESVREGPPFLALRHFFSYFNLVSYLARGQVVTTSELNSWHAFDLWSSTCEDRGGYTGGWHSAPTADPGSRIRIGFPLEIVKIALRRSVLFRGLVTLAALLAVAGIAEAQIDPSGSLLLQWTATGDDGDDGQVTSYQVRYHTTGPGSSERGTLQSWWDAVPSAQRLAHSSGLVPSGETESLRVTGLSPSTTYHFVVRAVDEAGNVSDFSNVAQGTTAAACVGPTSSPSGFVAAADTGEVVVTWDATTDPDVVSLHLYRASGPAGAFSLLQVVAPDAAEYVDRSVRSGTVYRYRAAWMGAACEGPSTEMRTVTTPATSTDPERVAADTPGIRVFPNPASGAVTLEIHVAGTSSRHARIRLYDMKGRWIAELADAAYRPGTSTKTWRRTSRTGDPVGAGYYEIIGTIGDKKVRERLVLLP